jgi:hypothetical protein
LERVTNAAAIRLAALPETRRPEGPLGRVVGDLLVLYSSGSGHGGRRGRRIPFVEENGRHLPSATHLDLLNHPQVYEHLRDWPA